MEGKEAGEIKSRDDRDKGREMKVKGTKSPRRTTTTSICLLCMSPWCLDEVEFFLITNICV